MFLEQNTYGLTQPLNLASLKNQYDLEQIRILEQEKLYNYYQGNKDEIEFYLKECITRVFGSEIVDDNEWLWDWQNLTQKIINQLAVVYREPAERDVIINGVENEDLSEYLEELLPDSVNTKDKKAHRFAKLLNTSLTQITFDKETGKVKLLIEPSHKYKVEVDYDDPYKITAVKYLKYYKNDKGKEELYTVVWTKEEHYREDANGQKRPIGENLDMVNPFGIIPFAKLTMQEGEDVWGEGQNDIVNTNEIINVLLTSLTNDHIISGGAGILITTNLGLATKKTDDGQNEQVTQKARSGRRHPFSSENVRTDMVTPDAKYVTTEPLITEIQENIDYRIKQIAILKGLNPNTFLADVQASSGYSKVMDALEQLEIRRDDLEPCRDYEQERYEIIKAVNNTYYKDVELRNKFGLKLLPEDSYLQVDFADIKIEETPEQKIARREHELTHNISTPKDWLMEDNPDLDSDRALEILRENREIRRTILNDSNTTVSALDTIKERLLTSQQINNNTEENLDE